MFIAMNRFKIVPGKENEFEKVWRERDTHLSGVNGFKEFHLVKGEKNNEFSLYASHSIWNSKEDFEGPREPVVPLSPLARLCQVLLMSNELVFVD